MLKNLKKLQSNFSYKNFSIFNKLKTFIEPSEKELNLTPPVDPNQIKVQYYDPNEEQKKQDAKHKQKEEYIGKTTI
jgi:ribosome recycling factor